MAEWLRESGCPSARRTQQYCGTEGTSDITVSELSDWHIEHKATKSPTIAPSMLKAWFKQVRTDCPADKLPVIINTPNCKERIAILPLKSVNVLRNSLESFRYIASLYVNTIDGESYNFIKGLNKLYNEHDCSTQLYGGLISKASTYAILGSIKLDESTVEYYFVFRSTEWLAFAKELRRTTLSSEETFSLQEPIVALK